jgi:hypothetical protein
MFTKANSSSCGRCHPAATLSIGRFDGMIHASAVVKKVSVSKK